VIAFMLTAYVMTDGYDLGVAAISPLIARTDRERAAVMASIGPFWNGNEVWLVAAGGALFALFPVAYASSFSGFYLPFVIVLWLLMFRGLAMELREHFHSELWHQFWDAAFWLSSLLLILVFGVALGNLMRGLPLDASGYFRGTFGVLLNPYALLIGVAAIVTLGLHGACFVTMRVEGEPAARALSLLRRAWWALLGTFVAVSFATFAVRGAPSGKPWLFAAPVVSLIALVAMRLLGARGRFAAAFAASCAFIATLLLEAAGTLYPYLLPALPAQAGGISIFAAAPSPVGLTCALVATIAGIVTVLAYSTYVWRRMAGKVSVE